MSTSTGTDSPRLSGISSRLAPALETPANWRDALAGLVASRLALIQLESQGAARQVAKCFASLAIAALAAGFAWALTLAGGIAVLAAATLWPWYWIALVTAALHAVAAGVCLAIAKASPPPTYPLTRNEFQKDRAWLQTLKSPRK